ncbi:MAG: DUF3160 domain-containing protein [Candidatus Cohnella colombiensis]|uniref:DUF3160 domain-containing protein n=1 Tax=Candidatus Cohnella colombiensis TaxID=3121368 RepID=A0AA95EZ44_9BACL|nr:MAG: DUF3160 domain-containing protein [Cohnella sp.]
MKKFGIILLLSCIVLASCSSKDKNNNSSNTEQATLTPQPTASSKGNSNSNQKPLLKMNVEWASKSSFEKEKPAFSIPSYEAKVKPYKIQSNLANVENIGQFSGFTADQLKGLVENGFIVLPGRDTKMFYVYDDNEYSGIPNFVTSDSVLHTFHQFYDKSLMYVETSYLFDDLKLLTEQMLTHSIALYGVLQDDELKVLQQKNIVYFTVALLLLDPSSALIDKVDPDALKLAKQEIKLIKAQAGVTHSPLFNADFDYSQFKVRGHYTRSEKLGTYFKIMMWYGTGSLPFYNKDGSYNRQNTQQALLMSLTTFLQDEKETTGDAELWAKIYGPTGQFVGLSDDIQVFTLNQLRISVFGEEPDPDKFNDSGYDRELIKAIEALPEPQIQGKVTSANISTGKQFRFMGQRYTLDGDIMQDLMEPIVRPIPSGLDVMGVLGSNLAEDLLLNVYKPQERWADYPRKYKALENEVAKYPEQIWKSNLYNGWLWTIQSELKEYDTNSGMPMFMTNLAWKSKSLNAALGSYAELKHDTVLYGKQPAAEMGGAWEYVKQHYVEPNVELYTKLLYLTDYTLSLLEERDMGNSSIRYGAEQYETLLKFLITCSIKELRNEPLTDEENDRLLWYGGTIENIMNSFLIGVTEVSENMSPIELSHMLVSDVATILPNQNSAGGVLSLGTGTFDHIYVVVPINGKLMLSRGSVYSYYEFLSDTRLTDEEWWSLHGLNQKTEEYGPYFEITDPSPNLPKQPDWVKAFKFDRNLVAVEPLEVNWDQLNE